MGKVLACMVTGNSSAMSLKYDRPGIKMWFHHLCRRYNKAQPIGYTGVKLQLQGHQNQFFAQNNESLHTMVKKIWNKESTKYEQPVESRNTMLKYLAN
jgi:hypothetical protein